MSDILIIPDPHASPKYGNERFDALGRFIISTQPEHIVCLGDFADLSSISSHNTPEAAEGQRFLDDLVSAKDAMGRLLGPTEKYNARARLSRKKLYSPNLCMLGGNHEQRINTLCANYPYLSNIISLDQLPYEQWKYISFKRALVIGGIHFSHYFTSGVMGRPISGVNISRSLITKMHVSCVQGHSHLYSHAEDTLPNGQKIFGLSAGCFSHHDYSEHWCRDTEFRWWRGIIVLKDIDGEGYYDEIRSITMRKLMRDYL